MIYRSIIFITLAFLVLSSELFPQTTITTSASKDNTIFETPEGNSNGKGIHFFAGRTGVMSGNSRRRALITFDLSQIPTGATIQSASLTLPMTKTSSGAQAVALHRVSADWGEGSSNAGNINDGDGALAQSGDATWVHRFFNTDFWTNDGGDFNPTPSASISVSGIRSYTWGSTAAMVADVQSWIDNPSTNFGWIIIGNEAANSTTKQFASRESSANPPQLSVTFLVTDVADDGENLPARFSLAQNYPNPFNPSTVINYSVPTSANSVNVVLEVFNLMGQKVRTLVNEPQPGGSHSMQWDGKNDAGELLASAVYAYRLRAGDFTASKKMAFVK